MTRSYGSTTKGTEMADTEATKRQAADAEFNRPAVLLASSVFVATVLFVAFVGFVPSVALAQSDGRIVEIRVHGNHTTPDADILALSGLTVGEAATDARLGDAERGLKKSGRFADVEVRRRYLSLDDASQVVVMIVVGERAGVTDDDLTPGPLTRLRARTMWLPIVSYADGYGLTYGVRTAFVGALGERTSLSVPLTWGGERRAGLELQRPFGGDLDQSPLLRLSGGVAAYRRVNPFFRSEDTRVEARVRAEHAFLPWLRVGGGARSARVDFNGGVIGNDVGSDSNGDSGGDGASDVDRHDAFNADVILDTRLDPSFPRNAIYAELGREQLRFDGVDSFGAARRLSAGRWSTDLRGYVGAIGTSVVAVRARFITSNRALPASEQSLLGGSDTLRGYRAGTAAGDNLGAVSVELRVPLTSPVSVGRFGVKAFVDHGTTWSAGSPLGDAPWQRGIGGGVFFGGGPVLLDAAIAWPEHGGARGHFGLGVTF